MNCDVTYEELSAYALGDLPVTRTAAIQEHLHGCGVCQRRMSTLGRMEVTTRLWAGRPVPAAAVAAVRSALGGAKSASEVMTLPEVADFLRLSMKQLGEIADELPAFELAGQLRVRRERLVAWLEQREHLYTQRTVQSRMVRSFRDDLQKGVA